MIIRTLLCVVCLFTGLAFAQHDHHHPKHNMVMLGHEEIFISHIVYKVPHNYQVILKINLDKDIQDEYLKALTLHPGHLFILLLDSLDISKIKELKSISGTVLVEDSEGKRTELIKNIKIKNFEVIFFDEVPLSLE